MGGWGLQRMAGRMARRAGIAEEGVAVSFGFKSLAAAMLIGALEELPLIGLVMTFATFGMHRIALVTDRQTYVFRAKPFHRPGEVLGQYPVGHGVVARVRGKLTFPDGLVVWHSPLFAARARRVELAANGTA